MWLVRRVESLGRWDHVPPDFAPDEVPADVLTQGGDLKTRNNELSFWCFDPHPDWERDAVLAILGTWKTLNDGLHVAWVEQQLLQDEGVRLKPSRGRTFFADLQDRHVDAVVLDAHRLAKVACLVALAIRQRAQYLTLTRAEIAARLAEAVESRRIQPDNMPAELRAAVTAELEARAGSR